MTIAQHHALLPRRSLVALGGPDWRGFLQGLITQDVESLAPGELRYGALLTPQGRLLFDLFIEGRDDGCRLEVAADRREALLQRLTMYRLRAKVTIQADDTPVAAVFPGDGPSPGPGWLPDPRLPALGWRGYGAAAPAGAEPADEATYDFHRLALGVGATADWAAEDVYPIEANFDLLGGIDFKKGCFVGQETTSRMKRRGQVKSRLMGVTFVGEAPAPGAEILAGELRAGEILSGARGRAMALLRLDRMDGPLTVEGRHVTPEKPGWIE